MDHAQLKAFSHDFWQRSILECLQSYIRIPCKSPQFDPEWQRNGYLEAAMELVAAWCREHLSPDASVEIRRLPGRTPLLLVDIPGDRAGCVVLYGHLDKQPEFSGWAEGLGPWKPVLRDGKLYGRGGADDGYAAFGAVAAILALRAQRVPVARCVLLIEASEESSSIDLPAHLDALADRIGNPSLVICLDADCGDYERLWCTTSLRGLLNGTLQVRVLDEGVHSMASGIVPTPFRILAQLLQRLESSNALETQVPRRRMEQIVAAAAVLAPAFSARYPWTGKAEAVTTDVGELLANATWRSALAVIGADGLPATRTAGNVLLPAIALKLSMRLPPTCDAIAAARTVTALLESDPPYGAAVSFAPDPVMQGWHAAEFSPAIEKSLSEASQGVFGRDAMQLGSGGSIPFVAMLARRFSEAQFFVTGVLGPRSNAHGPNEFLHIGYAEKLTACVSLILAAHDGAGHG